MRSNPALRHLSRDPVLNTLINKYASPKWEKGGVLFQNIVENIIGQQLSGRPAEIITERFISLFPRRVFPEPVEILKAPDDSLRSCGMSWAKVRCIKNLSLAVSEGSLDLEAVKRKPAEEVISELTKIKGIGKWTAEMVLIFHLQHPDVFSLGDLGLRTAVSLLYGVDRNNLDKITMISDKWSPYRSLACRYLWLSLEKR